MAMVARSMIFVVSAVTLLPFISSLSFIPEACASVRDPKYDTSMCSEDKYCTKGEKGCWRAGSPGQILSDRMWQIYEAIINLNTYLQSRGFLALPHDASALEIPTPPIFGHGIVPIGSGVFQIQSIENTYYYEPYKFFNGYSDYITVPDSTSLDLTQFSIALWFRTSKVYRHDPVYGGEGIMVMKGGWGSNKTGENLNYGIWISDANHIRGGFEETNGRDHLDNSFPVKYNDGVWHHVVITYDQLNLRLYIDGVEKKTNATKATPEINAQPLTIGKNPLTFKKAYYYGDMDEVYVWNNDLTADEVQELYQSGTIPQSSKIVYSNTFGGSGNETTFIEFLTNLPTALADIRQNNQALMIFIIGAIITFLLAYLVIRLTRREPTRDKGSTQK